MISSRICQAFSRYRSTMGWESRYNSIRISLQRSFRFSSLKKYVSVNRNDTRLDYRRCTINPIFGRWFTTRLSLFPKKKKWQIPCANMWIHKEFVGGVYKIISWIDMPSCLAKIVEIYEGMEKTYSTRRNFSMKQVCQQKEDYRLVKDFPA